MKTTCCAGAIRTKLIHAVSACARVMCPHAGFGQRLLAWLLVHLHAPTLLPKLVKVTLRKNYVQEFCYIAGNHG